MQRPWLGPRERRPVLPTGERLCTLAPTRVRAQWASPEPLLATTAAGPVDPWMLRLTERAATEVELTNMATAEAESDAVGAEP